MQVLVRATTLSKSLRFLKKKLPAGRGVFREAIPRGRTF